MSILGMKGLTGTPHYKGQFSWSHYIIIFLTYYEDTPIIQALFLVLVVSIITGFDCPYLNF